MPEPDDFGLSPVQTLARVAGPARVPHFNGFWGAWRDLVEWGRRHWIGADRDLADPEDLVIPLCVDSVDEAVTMIRSNLDEWASDGR